MNEAQKAFIAATVAQSKTEILEDIKTGRMPKDVSNFGLLHDHVDANEYGGMCEDGWYERANLLFPHRTDPDTISTQEAMDAANSVQNTVNKWLTVGGHHIDAELLVMQMGMLDDEQIDCLADPQRMDEAYGMLQDMQARVGVSEATIALVARICFAQAGTRMFVVGGDLGGAPVGLAELLEQNYQDDEFCAWAISAKADDEWKQMHCETVRCISN